MSSPSKTDLAGSRLELAGDHGDQRGLAGAVGPEQHAQLVLLDAEIEIVEDRVARDGGRQARDLEKCHCRIPDHLHRTLRRYARPKPSLRPPWQRPPAPSRAGGHARV